MKQVLHCYCRVSSEIQSTEGTSLASQKELGKLKAKQLGMTHKLWAEGVASSNSEDIAGREVLSSLMTGIEDGQVKHLYVTDLSRLARTDNVASMIRYRCNMKGVTLYIKDVVYDFNEPMDVLTVQIMSAFSQFENAIRKERVRLGKLEKVRDGYWHGGPPPYGFKLAKVGNSNKLAIEPDEAKWVREIFNWYKDNQSLKFIQQRLRENYVIARRGGSFSLGSLRVILHNTHHTGTYTFKDGVSGEQIEVSCPRIIDDALWDECQNRQHIATQRRSQINRTVHFSLLKEMMWCGHCGGAIGAKIQPSQRKEYYYCPKKERMWKTADAPSKDFAKKSKTKANDKWKRARYCEMTKSLNITATNDTVWELVTELASKSNVLKEKVKTEMMSSKNKSDKDIKSDIRNLQDAKKRYLQERTDLETAVAKIETDRVMKRISASQTKGILKNINEEIASVEARLQNTDKKLKTAGDQKKWVDWVGEFQSTYTNTKKLDDEGRKKYLSGIVDRINVRLDADTGEHMLDVKFHYPIVADRLVKSKKKKGSYTIYKGKRNKTVSAKFNFNSSGKSKKKAK